MDAITEKKVETLIHKFSKDEVYKKYFILTTNKARLIGNLKNIFFPVVYSDMDPTIIKKAKTTCIMTSQPRHIEKVTDMFCLIMKEVLPIIFPDFKIIVEKQLIGKLTEIIIKIDLSLLAYTFFIEIWSTEPDNLFVIKNIEASENLEYKYYMQRVLKNYHVSEDPEGKIMNLVKPKAKISSAYILDVLQSLHCRLRNLENVQ